MFNKVKEKSVPIRLQHFSLTPKENLVCVVFSFAFITDLRRPPKSRMAIYLIFFFFVHKKKDHVFSILERRRAQNVAARVSCQMPQCQLLVNFRALSNLLAANE